jgi:hypothetical protein
MDKEFIPSNLYNVRFWPTSDDPKKTPSGMQGI